MPELTIKPDANPSVPDIIQRYLAGESLQAIAPDYQVATRTLYRWILSGIGDQQYQQLVTQLLVDRVADADVRLETANDACQIARAREIARFARMDLERRRPKLYGQQRDPGPSGVTINIGLSPRNAASHQVEKDVTNQGEDSASSCVISQE